MLTKALTIVKSLNKTDVTTLLESFGSLKGIAEADEKTLIMCPGFGDKKAKKLYQTLHEPFLKKKNVPVTIIPQKQHTNTIETHSSSSSSNVPPISVNSNVKANTATPII